MAMYGFPVAVLDPGCEGVVDVQIGRVFCVQRLFLVGQMDEVRGHFKIRYSRLPLLNRENVIAYSNVTRHKSKRRTTVEYREGARGNFVRSYLPSSVEYRHVDPLSYVTLDQMYFDEERGMPSLSAGGPSAAVFGSDSFGNGLSLPACSTRLSLAFRNRGDIQVRVHASVMGVQA